MSERRIAVTGIGLVCALGTDREQVWQGLIDGRCGMGKLTLFDNEGYRSDLVAEIPDFGAERRFTPAERRRLSRSDQVMCVATEEALGDSDLTSAGYDPLRVGVIVGAGTGDLLRNEEYHSELLHNGIKRAWPSKVYNHFSSTPADVVATRYGLLGMKASLVSACSSSTVAIGYAGDAIRSGMLDAAVCGGADVLCRLTLSGFNALRLVSQHPCRPFDVARDGLNIGEAAAILVLEEMSSARRRSAQIYAELAGYAARCEAYHATAPEPSGAAVKAVLDAALRAARVPPQEVDHVNSHGTATIYNDRAEARGLHQTFGARARSIPVNSIKSMVGHCLGTAGAVEAATLALTIAHGIIPPTVNHDQRDPECDLDVVAGSARETAVQCGVSLSLAFGGNDAALVMRRAA